MSKNIFFSFSEENRDHVASQLKGNKASIVFRCLLIWKHLKTIERQTLFHHHQSAKRREPMCLRSLVPSEETRESDPSFSKRGVHLFLNSFSLSKSSTIFMFSVGFGGSCFQKDILNLVYIRFHNSSSPTHMKSFGLFVTSLSVTWNSL